MIDEMNAVKATIVAAEIQKMGTIWAAIIGGCALAGSVFASWRTALHLQKVARLAETRKNVYLHLAESYSELTTSLYLLLFNIPKNIPKYHQALIQFGREIDKTIFICETETKEEIFKFLKLFEEKINSIAVEVEELKDIAEEVQTLSERHKKYMDRFEEASNVLERIKIEGGITSKVELILKYFDEQLKLSEECIILIEQKESELDIKIDNFKPKLDLLTNTLNSEVLNITHLLRKELGARTDVNLDKMISSEFNK